MSYKSQVIPLKPDTIYRLSEILERPQAELEVRLSQANDRNEVIYYRIETNIIDFSQPKEN